MEILGLFLHACFSLVFVKEATAFSVGIAYTSQLKLQILCQCLVYVSNC